MNAKDDIKVEKELYVNAATLELLRRQIESEVKAGFFRWIGSVTCTARWSTLRSNGKTDLSQPKKQWLFPCPRAGQINLRTSNSSVLPTTVQKAMLEGSD